jgi:hypothetical protein
MDDRRAFSQALLAEHGYLPPAQAVRPKPRETVTDEDKAEMRAMMEGRK